MTQKGPLFQYIKLQLITEGENVLKIGERDEEVLVSVSKNGVPSFNNIPYNTIIYHIIQ